MTVPQTRDLVELALSKRLKQEKSRLAAAKLVRQYLTFTTGHLPNALPVAGDDAVISISAFLMSTHGRGPTVPGAALHALKVYSEALGLNLPLIAPCVIAATRAVRTKPVKQAQPFPLEFLQALETIASKPESTCFGRAVYAAGFSLMCLASMRFADTRPLSSFNRNTTAVYGFFARSKTSELPTPWAAPLVGVTNYAAWSIPIFEFRQDFWGQNSEEPCFLFPNVDPLWGIVDNTPASYRTVLSALRRLATETGTGPSDITLHSPRNFLATCANQLGWAREERETLGRWAPGSSMPNRYDMAARATELRLRYNVLETIRKGWRPADAFEIPQGATLSRNEHPTGVSKHQDAKNDCFQATQSPSGGSEDEMEQASKAGDGHWSVSSESDSGSTSPEEFR